VNTPRPSSQAGARLVFLGTAGGPTPAVGRKGIATALVVDGDVYLVDAGYGVLSQYLDAGLRLDRLRAVLITHLHGDHIADLFNLFMFGSHTVHGQVPGIDSPVDVIGPGTVVSPLGPLQPYGEAPYAGLAGFFAHSYAGQALTLNAWSMGMSDIRKLVRLHEIPVESGVDPATPPFTVLENENVRITAVPVPEHLIGSFAFRIDTRHGSVAFSGDTGPSSNVSGLARGADILVHEVMDFEALVAEGFPPEMEPLFTQVHTEVRDVGKIAADAGVPKLALNHFVPPSRSTPPEQWKKRIRHCYNGEIIIAEDLLVLPLHTTKRPRS
jgi:ribonuclease BN (tRNA processing enzyme)